MSSAVTKKRTLVSCLPSGWVREECVRQNGLSRGKSDIYYIGPSGRKVSSKSELTRLLGTSCDLSGFDYKSGRIIEATIRSSRTRYSHSSKPGKVDFDTASLTRRTPSMLKQSVTKKTNHKTNKVKTDHIKGEGKSPQQIFREKRLTGLHAVDTTNAVLENVDLSEILQAVEPVTSSEDLLRRISTQLLDASFSIIGQTSSNVTKDPSVWLNPQQPACKSFKITEDDIRKQECRVSAARKQLEHAIQYDIDLQRKELMVLM